MTQSTATGTDNPAATVKSSAADVASHASEQASAVTGTAKDQAGAVIGEAKGQAQQLLSEATDQLGSHAADQTQRASGTLRELGDHLTSMAEAGPAGSPAQSLVHDIGSRSHAVASYLDGKSPNEILADLQDFGRRRPAAFIAGAAIAGLVVGRFGKAAKQGRSDSGTGTSALPGSAPTQSYAPIATAGSYGSSPSQAPAAGGLTDVTPGAATVETPYAAPTVATGFPDGPGVGR